MPSSEPHPANRSSERRMRWIAAAALLVLVPCTIAATGWRDLAQIDRMGELRRVDVPAGGTADYNGARIAFVGLNAIPLEPGLPADRTFVRTRFTVEPRRAGTQWLDCQLHVVDSAGHAWAAIDMVPDLVQRTLARPGEPEGTICTGLAVSEAQPGSKVVIDAYYLVPRPAIPALRATMSTMDGRPAYLRFAASTAP